ncbi:MAG: hypothetical protein HY662_02775 [Chloroflexi bacterium]|nr:hypothetical protein [Chloroflexota bacterium]
MDVKCDKCDREFKEEEAHEHPGKVRVYRNKVMCEDCLIDLGVTPDEAEPYWTYIRTRTDFNRMI